MNLADEVTLAYEADLKTCEDAGNWSHALDLLGFMRSDGVKVSRRAWTSGMGACARGGRWAEALRLMADMDKAREPPDHTAYNAAIEACGEQGAHQQAGQLMLEMRQRGLQPQMDTYARLLRVLVQNGMTEDARSLYQEASTHGFFDVWVNRGRFLDLQEFPIEVAEVILRFAVEERADEMARRGKAGKGGFYVLTGQAHKSTAYKQQAVLRIMREEFGLKVRVDPARFGRVQVRGMELKRIGEERQRAEMYSSQVRVR